MTGLYGVMSYTVTERTTEIGIGMALGAQRTNITAMILGKASTLQAAGLRWARACPSPRLAPPTRSCSD
jgi:macrolide transport system ATP-binding/permease protein